MEAKPKTASNRRRSFRRKARKSVQVECRLGSYGMGPNLTQTVIDLFDSGVCLIVSHAFQNPVAEVEIKLSGYGLQKPIKRLANVRWQVKIEADGFCTGIEFQKRLSYRDWQILIQP